MSVEADAKEDSAAGVIPAAPWRVAAASVLPGFRLSITFRDGTRGVVDLSRVRSDPSHGIFAALADPHLFAQARVELGVVTWPNGADLDPLWMYEEISGASDRTWAVPLYPVGSDSAGSTT